jgi:hypothetical protein
MSLEPDLSERALPASAMTALAEGIFISWVVNMDLFELLTYSEKAEFGERISLVPDGFGDLHRFDCPTDQNNESVPRANTRFRWRWNVSAFRSKEFHNLSSFCLP